MSDAARILHDPPWPSVPRQREAATFGMWVFLASEALFFGALIAGYAVYRVLYPHDFAIASQQTNILYGSINTGLLITSSFTMTVAVQASEARMRRLLIFALVLTAAIGIAFIAVKMLEYKDDLDKHLLPGAHFALPSAATRLFFGLYWVMTGVHAIHLAVGCLLTLALAWAIASRHEVSDSSKVSPIALYWHFVDTIWIILYALIYLPGRP